MYQSYFLNPDCRFVDRLEFRSESSMQIIYNEDSDRSKLVFANTHRKLLYYRESKVLGVYIVAQCGCGAHLYFLHKRKLVYPTLW